METILINPKQIVGTAEVASLLGCSKQQIASLRKNPKFPAPIATLAATPLWDASQIAAFKADWKRRGKNRIAIEGLPTV